MGEVEADVIAKIEAAIFELPQERRGAVIYYFAQRFRYIHRPVIDPDLLKKKILDLGFSVRTARCLDAANYENIEQLLHAKEHDLLCLRNFGRTSLNEVKEKLASFGLELG